MPGRKVVSFPQLALRADSTGFASRTDSSEAQQLARILGKLTSTARTVHDESQTDSAARGERQAGRLGNRH